MAGVGEDEEAVDVRLHFHRRDGTVAGPYRLAPRWESCPQATGGSAAAVVGSETVSGGAVLPVAPPPPESVDLIVRRGSLVSTLSLVSCNSRQVVRQLDSVEGKVYLNMEVNPINFCAVLRFYEVEQDVTWKSTGLYSIDLPSPKSNPLGLFGNGPVYFHIKQNEIPPLMMNYRKNFHTDKLIGKGTEGTVYLCSSKLSSDYFAMKKVDQQNLLVREIHDEPSDVSILAMLDHKNIIELFLAWSEAKMTDRYGHATGSVFVLMKHYARSLMQYLKKTEETDVEARKYIFEQLIEALAYIHSLGIAHRDIKPANIMLEDDLRVKIIDFGIAKVKKPPNVLEFTSGVFGSAPYRAPEITDAYSVHNELVDVYSAGMIYYELFMPNIPQRKKRLTDLSNIIRKYAKDCDLFGRPPEVPSAKEPGVFNLDDLLAGTDILDDWTGDLKLLQNMINPERRERLSASKILELLNGKIADDLVDSDGPNR